MRFSGRIVACVGGAALVAMIGAGVLGWCAARGASHPLLDAEAMSRVREQRSVYRAADLRPFSDPATWEGVRSLAFEAGDEAALTRRQAIRGFRVSDPREPVALALEVLARRFGSSPEAYIEWWRGEGYALYPDAAAMRAARGTRAEAITRRLTGREMETFGTFAAAYEAILNEQKASPRRIGLAPGAVGVVYSVGHKLEYADADLAGIHTENIAIGSSASVWIVPSISREDVIERDGEILQCDVGLIVQLPGCAPHPVRVMTFYDPASRRWWFYLVTAVNAVCDRMLPVF